MTRHLLRRQLLRALFRLRCRVRVRVTIGFYVRFRVRFRVGYSLSPWLKLVIRLVYEIYTGANVMESKVYFALTFCFSLPLFLYCLSSLSLSPAVSIYPCVFLFLSDSLFFYFVCFSSLSLSLFFVCLQVILSLSTLISCYVCMCQYLSLPA